MELWETTVPWIGTEFAVEVPKCALLGILTQIKK